MANRLVIVCIPPKKEPAVLKTLRHSKFTARSRFTMLLSPAKNRWLWRNMAKMTIRRSTYKNKGHCSSEPGKNDDKLTKMAAVTLAKPPFAKNHSFRHPRKKGLSNPPIWNPKNPDLVSLAIFSLALKLQSPRLKNSVFTFRIPLKKELGGGLAWKLQS